MVTCTVCGRASHDSVRFCYHCGRQLVKPISGGSLYTKPVPTVTMISPFTSGGPPMARVTPQGMCKYHPDLPAFYICTRCGKPICRDCSKYYLDLVICPQCFIRVVPRQAPIYPRFGVY